MHILTIFLIIAVLFAVAAAVLCFISYHKTFYVPDRVPGKASKPQIPDNHIYAEFKDVVNQWILEARKLPYEEMKICSHDGLELYAKFYEFAPGAPLEIMFHGYRGSAERDLAGGIQRAFKLGRSVLLVDQRCSGKSGGNIISFGINEHKDCLRWVDFAAKKFGPDRKIILTGISMGAATVLMVADKELPENVIGILADCGYSTAKDVIKKVIRQMKLPAGIIYPFVKLTARVFCHFDLEEHSPLEAVKRSRLPIIFYHGEADNFVPCEMSRINYEACTSRKMLVTVPGAGHGLSYPKDPERYLSALAEFFGPDASYSKASSSAG